MCESWLKKVVERAVILTTKGEYIDTPVLPKEIFQRSSDGSTGAPMLLPLRDLEKEHLRKGLGLVSRQQELGSKSVANLPDHTAQETSGLSSVIRSWPVCDQILFSNFCFFAARFRFLRVTLVT